MPRQPWMKWYPGDWRADPKLRMCGLAARGLWADMLALMHEAEPYGHLLVNGSAPTTKQLASLAGATERDCRAAVEELRHAGVFSETDEGVIFSRRMVRDQERAERNRLNGAQSGGNPHLATSVNPHPNQPEKISDIAQKLEARSQKENQHGGLAPPDGVDEAFDRWWRAHPNRTPHPNPKKPARAKFRIAVRDGADPETLIAAAGAWARAEIGKDRQHVAQALTWLNQARWEQYAAQPDARPPSLSNLTPDESDRLIRLERLIATATPTEPGKWLGHHGPRPSLDEARAELAHLTAKRDGKAAA